MGLPQTVAKLPVTVVDEHDTQGRLTGRASMAANRLHGEFHRYRPDDGMLLLRAYYEHGVLCGRMRVFDGRGRPAFDAHYLAGRLHGVASAYVDGRLVSQQHYVHGILHGEHVSYAPSGLEILRMTYSAGQREGEAVYLHEGVATRREAYRDGVLEGDVREYAPDGSLVQAIPYRAGLAHGTARRFAPGGRVLEERVYRQGKPQGEWQRLPVAPTPPAEAGGARIVGRFEKWVRG
ncbi:hypothetical protein CY652_22935 [Burkholderia sp. WAC0059]|nr:hypothetical protein CY652_22935 [Burkholderia sp. WAC0059]